jgi:hypothetical protein
MLAEQTVLWIRPNMLRIKKKGNEKTVEQNTIFDGIRWQFLSCLEN